MKTYNRDIVQTYLAAAFDKQDIDSHEESVEIILDAKEHFSSPELLHQFRTLILDPTRTWSDKAAYIFPIFDPRVYEEEYLERFKYMWNTVMEVTEINEPWPLDEK